MGKYLFFKHDEVKYNPLNTIQIKDFLERNNIDALDIKEIGNYSVILYQTSDVQGNWQLTSDQNGKISGSHGSSSNNSEITKVNIARSGGGGGERGYINFITLVIYDKKILGNAERIVVDNGNCQSEEYVNKRKGIIMADFSPKVLHKLKIKLLDKTGNILFYGNV